MHVLARVENALLRQRAHLLCWAPVCLGLGIGAYFALWFEPDVVWLIAGACATVLLAGLGGLFGAVRVMLWGVSLCILGFSLAGIRAHSVAAPVLSDHYYGSIQGRLVAIDRSASDAVRLTLDEVILSDMPPLDTPARVRISLHGDQQWLSPQPYQWIGVTGHLSSPSGPVEPGGFDFQRYAWFQGLGAVGYARAPALALRHAPAQPSLLGLRHQIAQDVQARLPGDIGGLAAAVTTGIRTGLSQQAVQALRTTNLAHLLAISGLHMGLLAGFVFWSTRAALSLMPAVSLRVPVKKVAACCAIVAASGYLALSGASIATERAFVMACVALVAVVLDRRVFSLRAVAVAALILLGLRPESLLSPGFQMSFAATTALVAVFHALRGRSLGPAWAGPFVTVFLSSAVAGLATAPFAAAHFNVWATYGLLANLLAVPVMGTVVVPAAVLAVCLVPLGLEQIGLTVMGAGLRWILGVAQYFEGLDGARVAIVAPPTGGLEMLSLGAIFAVLWQGSLRCVGAGLVILALVGWSLADRPEILIADSGKLVGVMTDTGRGLSRASGQGFIAARWLENDGDLADQQGAAQRIAASDAKLFSVPIKGGTLWHVSGKRSAKLFKACGADDIVVSAVTLSPEPGCTYWGPDDLKHSGAIALSDQPEGWVMTSVRDKRGQRLWSPRTSKYQ